MISNEDIMKVVKTMFGINNKPKDGESKRVMEARKALRESFEKVEDEPEVVNKPVSEEKEDVKRPFTLYDETEDDSEEETQTFVNKETANHVFEEKTSSINNNSQSNEERNGNEEEVIDNERKE